MNIIYFHVHDMGRWVEPYGHPIPAPNYAALAKECTLFRQAFSAAPTCSPSRAALLTGLSPHCTGMLGLAHRGFGLTECAQHLASWFSRHGYLCALSGIQHETVAGEEKRLGYERVLTCPPVGSHVERDRLNTESACAFLRETHARPFFLSLGLFFPHRAFPPLPEDSQPGYLKPPYPMPDTPESRADFAAYCGAVALADQCLGELRRTLAETGRDRDTVLLITTDHGPAMPGMKCTLSDGGTGVALMLRYPDNPARGKVLESLVSHLDIYPTLCELGGVPKPDWLEGRSLLPLLEGKVDSIRDEVQFGVTYHAAYQPMRGIRTATHKLVRRFFPPTFRPVPANIDDGPTKDFLFAHDWQKQAYAEWELYDLRADSYETRNLAYDPAHAKIFAAMGSRLEDWMQRTKDPLLNGDYVPFPPGARINLPTCLSATEEAFETAPQAPEQSP